MRQPPKIAGGGERLVVADMAGQIRLLDVATGGTLREISARRASPSANPLAN